MSKMRLEVMLTAIDKVTAPLQGIAKQSQRLSRQYRNDMQGYNAVLKQSENALKGLRATQAATTKAGRPLTKAMIEGEQALLKRIKETTRAIDERKQKMSEEMAIIRKRQAYMDKGRSQVWQGTKRMAAAMGMTYAGTRMMQPGFSFEERMSEVQAITGLDKASEEMAMLRNQAKELGATTWASATQVAEGQSFLARAGFKAEEIAGAMPAVLATAKADNIEIAEAADIISNISSAFRIDAAEFESVADVLVAAFTGSNTSLAMLGESMKYIAPVAKDLDVPLEEATALAAVLGNVGIQGGEAGTASRRILSRLASPASAGIKALEQLGVETQDLEGNLRPPTLLLLEMAEAMRDLGTAERSALLRDIVGEQGVAAFSTLISDEGYTELMEMLDRLYNDREGIAERTAETMGDNVIGDFTALRSAIEGVQIAFSEAGGDGLRKFLQWLTKITQSVAKFLNRHPKLAKAIATISAGVIAITAALGGAAIAMGIFNMTIMANPMVTLVTAILAGLTALGVWIYSNRAALMGLWDVHVVQRYQRAVERVSNFFNRLGESMSNTIKKVSQFFKGGFSQSLEKIHQRISGFLSDIPIVGNLLSVAFDVATAPIRVVAKLFDLIIDSIKWIIEHAVKLKEALSINAPEWMKDSANFVGGIWSDTTEYWGDKWQSWFGAAEAIDNAAKGAEHTTISSSNQKTINDNRTIAVTVNAKTDASPHLIGAAVSQEMKNYALLGDLE